MDEPRAGRTPSSAAGASPPGRLRPWAAWTLAPFALALWCWVAGSLAWFEHWPSAVGAAAAAAWALLTALAVLRLGPRRGAALTAAVGLAWAPVFLSLQRPRVDREWAPDQDRVVAWSLEPDGGRLLIANVRDFRWRSPSDGEPRWERRAYELSELRGLDLVIEPLPPVPGMAHVLLSFGFADGRHLAVSVEIRKERGETFSPVEGLFRRYELAYVVADERDVLGLRLNARGHELLVHPLRATPEQCAALLLSMLERASALGAEPEFYDTAVNTCTTNLVRHFEDLRGLALPLDWRAHLPLHADALAWELGLIDGARTLEEARHLHRVTGPVPLGDEVGFSASLRSGRPPG